MSITPITTARATSIGGRNGHTTSDDGLVSVDLTIPRAMGGLGKPRATTPEHLFAAGYAACFGSACEFMGKQLKLSPHSVEVRAEVGLGKTPAGGFGLTVKLEAILTGLSQQDAEKVVAAGHALCPYSNAIKGNVDVAITVTVS